MVLSDDALQLARHRPPIELATGWSCLPYLFGVAIYCFEARSLRDWLFMRVHAQAPTYPECLTASEHTTSFMESRP